MKRFSFPLQRVRDWRQAQEEIESARLQELFAERQQVDSAVAQLAGLLSDARRTVQDRAAAKHHLAACDLARLDDFSLFVKHEGEVYAAKRRAIEQKIEEQRARLTEARRRVRLLDKLKERQFGHWERAFRKELDDLAGEQFLARWNQDRQT